MKPLLTTTACLLAATVVYAHISTHGSSGNTSDLLDAETETAIAQVGAFDPSVFGVIGAAAMAAVIATRRQRT